MVPGRFPHATPIIVLLLVTTGVAGSMHPVSATTEAPDPLPFDPLSPEEQARAVELVLRDDNITALLAGPHQIVGAALYTHKSFQDLDAWPRMAETWLYDHGSGLAVRALVDLGSGTVVRSETLAIQPPLTAAEVDLAGRMALGDPAIREDLRSAGVDPDGVEWTGRLWTGDAPTACPDHRCVLVGFNQGAAFLHEHMVLVDLTADQVLGLLGAGARPAQPDTPSAAGVLR